MNSKAFLLFIGVGAASLAYAADSRVGINIRIGPPAPVVVREAPPPPIVVEEHDHDRRMYAPAPGYVLIPRHHRWVNGRWEHVEAQWVMPPQPGARWVEGRWDRRSQMWTDEHWEVTTYTTAPGYQGYPPPPSAPPPPPYGAPPPVVYSQSETTYSSAPYAVEPEIAFEVAPPPRRREAVPARPSRHHVWVPGYWAAERGRHEWVSGRWEVPPEGRSAWVAPRWETRGHSYVFVRGYWK
jgi:hypothetical protein